MEFNDGFPQYEFIAQHDDDAGKGVRKRLMKVFWFLVAVTIIELLVGFFWHAIQEATHLTKTWLIIVFVLFTLVKAGYIVMAFMHLGDENKILRWCTLGPYFAFVVYLVYMTSIGEGAYSGLEGNRNLLDPILKAKTEAPAHHK